MKRSFKILLWVLFAFFLLGLSAYIYLRSVVYIDPPPVEEYLTLDTLSVKDGVRWIGSNWIMQRKDGLWEMYVEGTPYERGLVAGKLSEELIRYQEEVFVAQIREVVPSDFYLNFLRVFVAYFNRNLTNHIPLEYLQEIYGMSKSASDEFNVIGPPYMRLLNYHAAHDIGHALRNYALVGCTSFSAWGDKTGKNGMLSGRNFDFYFGDDFSRHKIVKFVAPSDGYPFAFITWGAMIGVVSGMNNEGLCVTINAARSDVPRSSATPVSILAREILQYAATIEEAIAIAEKRKTFVSESFLITSAKDGYAAIIEKSPSEMDVVFPDTNFIMCANHYQSETFRYDSVNIKNMQENATSYRFMRLEELIKQHDTMNVNRIASVLRDRGGLGDENIGLGNEKAINQMLAHHGVIFDPEQGMMYVSTHPNVLGEFVGYDIEKVFKEKKPLESHAVSIIPEDTFLQDTDYAMFLEYQRLCDVFELAVQQGDKIPSDTIDYFLKTNPDYFRVYQWVGDYYKSREKCSMAVKYYKKALKKEINNQINRSALEERISACH